MRRVVPLLPVALVAACTYQGRLPGADDVPGDDTPPALYADCAEARLAGEATSGVYSIDPDGEGAFEAYCDMETDDGGWTLALKIDGALSTFAYDSPLWDSADLYNADAADHDDTEAKLPSYARVASDHVMIETAGGRVWINPGGQEPLWGHVTGSAELAAPAGMSAWNALVPGSEVPNCFWFEGTNLSYQDYSVRIGLAVYGESQGECRTSIDATIGVGLKTSETCGDEGGPSPYGPPEPTPVVSAGTIDDGCSTPVFAYVYVRDWP